MSKRKQTEKLHLYAYENLRGLPTFLKDWSDNMAILDGAHSTVLSLINGLDDRLTTAEGLIKDLSPESIEDYKIRLNALEKKVVINTNSIKDVNTKIATVNAQINSINTEQGVQNDRLDALESLTNNHSNLISALRSNLTGVDGRVTTLEQCCENVQHEIADLQSDVDGFNQDITVMAGQIETLSNAVNELTELVNSLQLDVVSQRLDAFEADLTSLTTRVTTAESNITAHGNTLEEHNTRITENTGDIANIQNEIGDTDYSEISNTVSSSLVELADRIRALTPQEYDVLVTRLASAESDIDFLQSDVGSLQTDIGTVQNNIASLDDDVSNIQAVIPNDASSSNLLATNSDLPDITGITNALTVNNGNANETGLIRFGVDSSGNYGYKKVGADTVTPFSKSLNYASMYTHNIAQSNSTGNSTTYRFTLAANMSISVSNLALDLKAQNFLIIYIPTANDQLERVQILINDSDHNLISELLSSSFIKIAAGYFVQRKIYKITNNFTLHKIAIKAVDNPLILGSAFSNNFYFIYDVIR